MRYRGSSRKDRTVCDQFCEDAEETGNLLASKYLLEIWPSFMVTFASNWHRFCENTVTYLLKDSKQINVSKLSMMAQLKGRVPKKLLQQEKGQCKNKSFIIFHKEKDKNGMIAISSHQFKIFFYYNFHYNIPIE